MGKSAYKQIDSWIKYTQSVLFFLIYGKKIEKEVDKSWTGIKIKSTYFHPLYPKKNINDNSVTLFLELQHPYGNWKR